MHIGIETHDRDANTQLLHWNGQRGIESVEVAPGVVATYRGTVIRKSNATLPEIVEMAVNIGGGAIAGVVAGEIWAWLKSLKTKPEKITIDRTTVEFEEGQVTRLISERIEQGKSNTR